MLLTVLIFFELTVSTISFTNTLPTLLTILPSVCFDSILKLNEIFRVPATMTWSLESLGISISIYWFG